ncbi:hypothetical protein H6P81_014084 [Aristolochia fimbriata]|uniref:Fungal lipase-type domain-containing protein n=1 Tax=Aristolochia fimbriata TaxID=158543 RepID=A0AAV7EJB9_ARIFI|nr:hypothetical protein H6P81_014084 [Aristolochia fimbriata]
MEFLHNTVEPWIREQGVKFKLTWPQFNWPWQSDRVQKKKLQEEYERRKKQLQDLCYAVKADSVADLQDVLCSMVLSECVYKRPATEIVRVVNKFKADFGGQAVPLERVQISLDHVPHRYLLAEAGDTLFASFVGTKQYKDVIADANILQGAIFNEDCTEDIDASEVIESDQTDVENKKGENRTKPFQAKLNQSRSKARPAAHRGFMARAKGIPALELYRLAQKKNRKLVLCGHSLGGAVAVLVTVGILRALASASPAKENEKLMLKCITFSQPPVGNEALRDYVHEKGWHHYFKSYCIPEDLVPRFLSPAYFHHYNAQPLQAVSDAAITPNGTERSGRMKTKKNDVEQQLVLGVGPVQNSFWRLSRLVPIEGFRRRLDRVKDRTSQFREEASGVAADSVVTSMTDDVEATPLSLEIQEGSDGISLSPLPEMDGVCDAASGSQKVDKSGSKTETSGRWRRVPYLPSYVPFGELYLLGNSHVEALSDAEYSKLTSVRSVIAELRERFQSHSMKSYRSRFQKIYESCMSVNSAPFLGMDQLQQFPHLQQWLGLAVAGTVELGNIVEVPVIRTATSIVPLGWNGIPGGKNVGPLKVDITGHGLHHCTLVQAQVNGNWCSTVVESLPSTPSYSISSESHDLQRMCVLIGAPLRRPPQHQMAVDSSMLSCPPTESNCTKSNQNFGSASPGEGDIICPEGLSNIVVHCVSDFVNVSREVYVRTRRVRLIGLEGAGKTSLLNAILSHGRPGTAVNPVSLQMDIGSYEGMAGGLCYSDTEGVNLQELQLEANRFRDELWKGLRDLRWKTDLVVLVHNLSHKIPMYHQPNASEQQPALSLLLNEVKSLGIPWILAITNKFSVSADQQKSAISAVFKAYRASSSMAEVVNSCPYVIPNALSFPEPAPSTNERDWKARIAAQRLLLAPINFVRMPFQKRELVLPVEGVAALNQLVHHVLKCQEEASCQELIEERLSLELARQRASEAADGGRDSQGKLSSMTAAALGASVGAGLGVVLAVVMGAASALRKP